MNYLMGGGPDLDVIGVIYSETSTGIAFSSAGGVGTNNYAALEGTVYTSPDGRVWTDQALSFSSVSSGHYGGALSAVIGATVLLFRIVDTGTTYRVDWSVSTDSGLTFPTAVTGVSDSGLSTYGACVTGSVNGVVYLNTNGDPTDNAELYSISSPYTSAVPITDESTAGVPTSIVGYYTGGVTHLLHTIEDSGGTRYLRRSSDGGTSWTTVNSDTNSNVYGELCTDDSGTAWFIRNGAIHSVGMTSGATTLRLAGTWRELVYNTTLGKFVALDATGIKTSADGITWSGYKSSAIPSPTLLNGGTCPAMGSTNNSGASVFRSLVALGGDI